VNENEELDATSRTVEVRVENSDASLMPPFRALPGVDVCISHFVNGDIFSG
jgi:hypothetical protein